MNYQNFQKYSIFHWDSFTHSVSLLGACHPPRAGLAPENKAIYPPPQRKNNSMSTEKDRQPNELSKRDVAQWIVAHPDWFACDVGRWAREWLEANPESKGEEPEKPATE